MKIVNLLPKSKQREFYYHKLFGSLKILFIISGATFVLVLLAQFGTKLYLEHELTTIQSTIDRIRLASNKEENANLKKKIQGINNQISDYTTLAGDAPKWSRVLEAFSKLVPEQVYIQNFVVDSIKRQVSISGFAPSRESVIALYNNIVADNKNFSNIDYPLDNVSKPTDVQFRFTFTVEEKFLK